MEQHIISELAYLDGRGLAAVLSDLIVRVGMSNDVPTITKPAACEETDWSHSWQRGMKRIQS